MLPSVVALPPVSNVLQGSNTHSTLVPHLWIENQLPSPLVAFAPLQPDGDALLGPSDAHLWNLIRDQTEPHILLFLLLGTYSMISQA